MREARFDKTAYAEKTFEEADNTVAYWRSKTPTERIIAGYHLSLRAYGIDPNGPHPKIDKTLYRERKFSED